MNTPSHLSSTHSSPSEFDDETSMMETTDWPNMPSPVRTTSPPIAGNSAPSSVPAKAQTLPLQKRRRVTRACDECRRKKIKCDGKQPCTHCTVYSYECTYDQPSNRRRNPAPQYIEALETRLHRMEALLKVLLPDVDVNHPDFDLGKLLSQMQTNGATRTTGKDVTVGSGRPPDLNGSATTSVLAEKDSLLESIVEAAGRLDIERPQGAPDKIDHSSSSPENRFDASGSGGSSNPYDSLEVQLFGPLPQYLLQGQPQLPEGTCPDTAGQDIRMIASSGTQPNFMGVTSGAIGLDGFFGDQWGEMLLPRQDNS
ncbi:hypothetical protein HOY80DRAFT_886223 [Tuber brumale]|nr:hypothetical protein HOY80DRAFT_886223 [Tuber brumale]